MKINNFKKKSYIFATIIGSSILVGSLFLTNIASNINSLNETNLIEQTKKQSNTLQSEPAPKNKKIDSLNKIFNNEINGITNGITEVKDKIYSSLNETYILSLYLSGAFAANATLLEFNDSITNEEIINGIKASEQIITDWIESGLLNEGVQSDTFKFLIAYSGILNKVVTIDSPTWLITYKNESYEILKNSILDKEYLKSLLPGLEEMINSFSLKEVFEEFLSSSFFDGFNDETILKFYEWLLFYSDGAYQSFANFIYFIDELSNFGIALTKTLPFTTLVLSNFHNSIIENIGWSYYFDISTMNDESIMKMEELKTKYLQFLNKTNIMQVNENNIYYDTSTFISSETSWNHLNISAEFNIEEFAYSSGDGKIWNDPYDYEWGYSNDGGITYSAFEQEGSLKLVDDGNIDFDESKTYAYNGVIETDKSKIDESTIISFFPKGINFHNNNLTDSTSIVTNDEFKLEFADRPSIELINSSTEYFSYDYESNSLPTNAYLDFSIVTDGIDYTPEDIVIKNLDTNQDITSWEIKDNWSYSEEGFAEGTQYRINGLDFDTEYNLRVSFTGGNGNPDYDFKDFKIKTGKIAPWISNTQIESAGLSDLNSNSATLDFDVNASGDYWNISNNSEWITPDGDSNELETPPPLIIGLDYDSKNDDGTDGFSYLTDETGKVIINDDGTIALEEGSNDVALTSDAYELDSDPKTSTTHIKVNAKNLKENSNYTVVLHQGTRDSEDLELFNFKTLQTSDLPTISFEAKDVEDTFATYSYNINGLVEENNSTTSVNNVKLSATINDSDKNIEIIDADPKTGMNGEITFNELEANTSYEIETVLSYESNDFDGIRTLPAENFTITTDKIHPAAPTISFEQISKTSDSVEYSYTVDGLVNATDMANDITYVSLDAEINNGAEITIIEPNQIRNGNNVGSIKISNLKENEEYEINWTLNYSSNGELHSVKGVNSIEPIKSNSNFKWIYIAYALLPILLLLVLIPMIFRKKVKLTDIELESNLNDSGKAQIIFGVKNAKNNEITKVELKHKFNYEVIANNDIAPWILQGEEFKTGVDYENYQIIVTYVTKKAKVKTITKNLNKFMIEELKLISSINEDERNEN